MDKIDKYKVECRILVYKINELIEGYNDLKKRILMIDDDVTQRLDDYIHRLGKLENAGKAD